MGRRCNGAAGYGPETTTFSSHFLMQFSACPGCASKQAAELTVGKGTCRRPCNNHKAASQRE